MRKIPVILDTDIGTDIDDSWALAMLLNSPELDVKLVLTSTGDTLYRAKLVAKMLETANRTDIPIGIGIPTPTGEKSFESWIGHYDIAKYPGRVFGKGIDACIEAIMSCSEPVTLICISALTNIGSILKQQPEVVSRAKIVAMMGSIELGVEARPGPIAEYNVKQDVKAAQDVFGADWPITITPLDTCGLVKLTGRHYQEVCDSKSSLTQLVLEKYCIWDEEYHHHNFESGSSVLFDTVAIYLAFSRSLLEMKTLSIKIDDQGYTRVVQNAKVVDCAIAWKDIDTFKDLLAGCLR